ncbi:hypothetical protein Tco_0470684 [Tanacetum coccineum]
MGDENPISILRDYSKPSYEGYRNTIKLPEGNNVVPLRSDTIRLVQNGCLFHGLWSEDPNQHLKNFLKLVDSLDLNDDNRERMRLRESLSEAWNRFKDLLQKAPHHGIDLWLQVQIFYDHVNPTTSRTIDQSASDKLRDRNAEESWELLEDLALYNNENSLDLDGENRERTRLRLFQLSLRDQASNWPEGLPCEIDLVSDGKLQDKNADESWEIIENLSLYDYKGWNDSKEFVKLVKIARLALVDGNWLRLWSFGASALHSFDSRVRVCSLLTVFLGEEEKNDKDDVTTGDGIEKPDGSDIEMPVKEAEKKTKAKNGTKNEPNKKAEREEVVQAPSSQPI